MADETGRTGLAGIRLAAMGERVGGFIYGTIVALAVVVAGAKAYPHDAGHIAVLVAVTAVALWLAHVYAHGLAHSLGRDEHVSLAELRFIARREGSIIEATVPPLLFLLVGALGIVSTRVAVWGAFVLGLAVLAVLGFTFARIERLRPLATVAIVTANISLGAMFVALKLLLTH
jgi:hypothetical protein